MTFTPRKAVYSLLVIGIIGILYYFLIQPSVTTLTIGILSIITGIIIQPRRYKLGKRSSRNPTTRDSDIDQLEEIIPNQKAPISTNYFNWKRIHGSRHRLDCNLTYKVEEENADYSKVWIHVKTDIDGVKNDVDSIAMYIDGNVSPLRKYGRGEYVTEEKLSPGNHTVYVNISKGLLKTERTFNLKIRDASNLELKLNTQLEGDEIRIDIWTKLEDSYIDVYSVKALVNGIPVDLQRVTQGILRGYYKLSREGKLKIEAFCDYGGKRFSRVSILEVNASYITMNASVDNDRIIVKLTNSNGFRIDIADMKMFIDDSIINPIRIDQGIYRTPALSPGRHSIRVNGMFLGKTVDVAKEVEIAGQIRSSEFNPNLLLNRRLGNVKLNGLLSEGAFGYVFRGTDEQEEVAVKILIPDKITSTDRFIDYINSLYKEASYLMQLSVNNLGIVRIKKFHIDVNDKMLDNLRIDNLVDLINDPPYLVMELMRGGSLNNYMPSLSIKERKELAKKLIFYVGNALKSLHDIGIVHGDIKPSNILLSSYPSFGSLVTEIENGQIKVKLGDLGSAVKKGESALTYSLYSSFDQMVSVAMASVKNLNVTKLGVFPEDDVYAFGSTLYYLTKNKLLNDVNINGYSYDIDKWVAKSYDRFRYVNSSNFFTVYNDVMSEALELCEHREITTDGSQLDELILRMVNCDKRKRDLLWMRY
ncbi:protein kinase domain-containing protein [Sulfuracidifex metallicus]|uniref:protein kinase domain-containing protein n=1 Tax=Sulfuracidifex metallicus TaxID=47303 RepID=UPI0022763837|nr:protein kinase [Sulfuracidifex metallicus]MCY0850391.1 protein kinase [Sulfuracidifex metallicus]